MIYIDLDDVVANTWELVLELTKNIFKRKVEKKDLLSFNLAESLSLSEEQYNFFMRKLHTEENLLSIPLNKDFIKFSHQVEKEGIRILLVTGRPLESKSSTIKWVEKYSLNFEDILFVDKYSRYPNTKMTTLEDLKKIPFKLAIEDSYTTSYIFSKYLDIPFYIYKQPWNKKYEIDSVRNTQLTFFDSFSYLNTLISNGNS